jgi:hypothetical protein
MDLVRAGRETGPLTSAAMYSARESRSVVRVVALARPRRLLITKRNPRYEQSRSLDCRRTLASLQVRKQRRCSHSSFCPSIRADQAHDRGSLVEDAYYIGPVFDDVTRVHSPPEGDGFHHPGRGTNCGTVVGWPDHDESTKGSLAFLKRRRLACHTRARHEFVNRE